MSVVRFWVQILHLNHFCSFAIIGLRLSLQLPSRVVIIANINIKTNLMLVFLVILITNQHTSFKLVTYNLNPLCYSPFIVSALAVDQICSFALIFEILPLSDFRFEIPQLCHLQPIWEGPTGFQPPLLLLLPPLNNVV